MIRRCRHWQDAAVTPAVTGRCGSHGQRHGAAVTVARTSGSVGRRPAGRMRESPSKVISVVRVIRVIPRIRLPATRDGTVHHGHVSRSSPARGAEAPGPVALEPAPQFCTLGKCSPSQPGMHSSEALDVTVCVRPVTLTVRRPRAQSDRRAPGPAGRVRPSAGRRRESARARAGTTHPAPPAPARRRAGQPLRREALQCKSSIYE